MPNSEQPKRCVIADDVRASREILKSWLSDCNFECSLATDGNEAWEMIQRAPTDMLITDIEMPNCCGLELLQRIRADPSPQIQSIPVLMITSLHDGQIQQTIRRLGGNGLLAKPLDQYSTYSIVLAVLAAGDDRDSLLVSDPNGKINGDGLVSPTFRRLLKPLFASEP
ncbi:Chemotaxis protein CheY [Rosistilla oblonga]|uniref:Chemotaxis protein CheY n=1 Tax=Rosistilla oblonga TaxID=2527990 RepID=A0A518IVL4_9BACT|nr:response regulator [Rosistilla oblonga]QDV14725.1 Chemotaxis protein CheY [Rosistilla oblonga]QDV57129.1 Chemotaxis protein CheY [Rosistilla oblonga]